MSNKHKGMVALAALLLMEAFLKQAVSRTAKAVGVTGLELAIAGLIAGGIVAAID